MASPFDAAGFAKQLNPEQQKDFANLNRNTGGNFTNMGGEAGLRKRYGLGAAPTPRPPMAPPQARPAPGTAVSHGPGSGAPPTARPPIGVQTTGIPPVQPMPRVATPPGPGNLPPRGVPNNTGPMKPPMVSPIAKPMPQIATPPGPGNLPPPEVMLPPSEWMNPPTFGSANSGFNTGITGGGNPDLINLLMQRYMGRQF